MTAGDEGRAATADELQAMLAQPDALLEELYLERFGHPQALVDEADQPAVVHNPSTGPVENDFEPPGPEPQQPPE